MKQQVPYWTNILYGPILSRRLGSSLGINLFPHRKICNIDCIYCHFGGTAEGNSRPERFPLLSADEVGEALANYLLSSARPEVITFAGNGEPTLHPGFVKIVTEVIGVRDRLAPEVSLAILSNSTRINDPQVRAALLALDLRVMKLDVAEQETFVQMYRPHQRIQVEEIVVGLCRLRPLTIQSLFVEGEVENCSDAKVERLINALKQIQPREVEVYTAVRWTAERFVKAVDRPRLERIAAMINAAGIRARVY